VSAQYNVIMTSVCLNKGYVQYVAINSAIKQQRMRLRLKAYIKAKSGQFKYKL